LFIINVIIQEDKMDEKRNINKEVAIIILVFSLLFATMRRLRVIEYQCRRT
jgi:hypothetical protein